MKAVKPIMITSAKGKARSITLYRHTAMKLRAAKKLIIEAYSELVGFKMSPSMRVEQYLVHEVKWGNITPEEAAEVSLKAYETLCTKTFENKESLN